MSLFIGVDSSTTATKALVIDERGQVLAVGVTAYPYETPRPLWSEQDPRLWAEATFASIRKALAAGEIDPAQVAAVGLTGQMHGLVLLDESGDVLRPAILWNDQRTGPQCDEIRHRLGRERLIQITGNDALTGFTASKILWVQQEEPEVWAQARHILLPKDYVRYRLTGELAMDKAGGSGTQLFDLARRDWSDAMLAALDIPAAMLPDTFEGPAITGRISEAAAAATGLLPGTPVVAGGGDQAAGAVGVGAVREGVVALSLGTSGVVFASTNAPLIEPEGRLHAFCHAAPGQWHLMGVMLSAAGSLQWYRDALAPGVDFGELTAEAEDAPPGSEGLLFLPYLTGERTPHPDPLARGAWVGLTRRHQRAHLTRAVLEGVAFGLKDSFTLLQSSGLGEIRQVRISGGGAKSPLWRQILADALDAELATVNTTEGAAFGAALLAGVGAGVWPDVPAACDDAISITGVTAPDPAGVAAYRKPYELYRGLYPALKSTFHVLT